MYRDGEDLANYEIYDEIPQSDLFPELEFGKLFSVVFV